MYIKASNQSNKKEYTPNDSIKPIQPINRNYQANDLET